MGARIGEKRNLPGKFAEEWIKRAKMSLATSTNDLPLVVATCDPDGLGVRDIDGNDYLDFVAGVGVSNIGHCARTVKEAIRDQLKTNNPQFINTDFYNTPAILLAEKLKEITPGNHDKRVFLSNSGTEANEAAIKLAFDWHARQGKIRHKAVAFNGGFHGRTGYSLAVSSSKIVHKRAYPQAFETYFFDFPRRSFVDSNYFPYFSDHGYWRMFDYFFKHHDPKEVAFVIIEIIQGEGGVYELPSMQYAPLAQRARDFGWLIIIDEAQTGLGRTGVMWAIDNYSISENYLPDIITSAKALGGGALPCGATIFRAELDWQENGRHSNTFGGNNLACAAALAGIKELQYRYLLENVNNQSFKLQSGIKNLMVNNKSAGRFIRHIRGRGLLLGFDIVLNGENNRYLRNRIVSDCLERGLIVLGCGEAGIRLEPPLIITDDDINTALEIFNEVFADIIV